MTTAVQHRRGTTAEHAAFTGLEGEVTIDTTKDTAVIHDGTLTGGYPLAKENLANVTTSGLSSIDGASTASDDKFFIFDQSATSLKTITRAELNNAMEQDALANVSITGGTINGTTIGGTTAAGGSFTTLTTSGAVTLSGGTANGVAYLNGSKVLTSGSALTFDGSQLYIAGTGTVADLRFSSTGYIKGGSNVGDLRILADRFRLYNLAGTQLAYNVDSTGAPTWYIGGSEQMRLTSTGLGIGTSSPTNKLSVSGNANITGNTTLGDASTDTVTVNGYMGIGAGASNTQALRITNNSLTGTVQYGIFCAPVLTSAATVLAIGVAGRADTQDAAFTVADATALYAFNPTKGAASTITNSSGLIVKDQTAGVNNFGIKSEVSSGTNKWNIYASGTAANYFAGNVGIGTSAPFTDALLTLGSAQGTSQAIVLNGFGADNESAILNSNGNLIFKNGAGTTVAALTERLRITSSGNVGIGTSSPALPLHVYNASAALAYFESTSAVGPYVIWRSSGTSIGDVGSALGISGSGAATDFMIASRSGPLLLGTGSAAKATLDSSGNLGLGVTPSAWRTSEYKAVQVGIGASFYGRVTAGDEDKAGFSANAFYDQTDNRWEYLATDSASRYDQLGGGHYWYTAPSGTAGNAISFTQAMTLDASGKLVVGATSAGARFQVTDSSSAAATALMRFVGQNNYQMDVQSVTSTNSTVGSRYNFLVNSSNGEFSWSNSGGERARIDHLGRVMIGTTTAGGVNGITFDDFAAAARIILNKSYSGIATAVAFQYNSANVGSITYSNTATAYNTSSDYRLKNITGPITTSGAYIDSLNPVEGTWKADGSTFVGLIAHEAQEASRTPVATGVKDGEEMQGMDYSSAEIIANLIAEVKSLRQRLAAAGI